MKTYWMRFGSGDPRVYTGLNPTFLIFSTNGATVSVPPSLAEFPPSSGLYAFSWGTTTSIAFLADAATTSPGATGRYVTGSIDPSDRADEYGTTIVAIGTSNIALGTTIRALGTSNIALGNTILATVISNSITSIISGIGTTASSFGNSTTDPGDLFGYLKRIMENLEGNQTFIKPTGILTIFPRSNSVTLAVKTITNSTSSVIKT